MRGSVPRAGLHKKRGHDFRRCEEAELAELQRHIHSLDDGTLRAGDKDGGQGRVTRSATRTEAASEETVRGWTLYKVRRGGALQPHQERELRERFNQDEQERPRSHPRGAWSGQALRART